MRHERPRTGSAPRHQNVAGVTVFRTPEQVAPDMGVPPRTLRRYVRESGICTRLERNRITLDRDDEERLRLWIKTRPQYTPDGDLDPFA